MRVNMNICTTFGRHTVP